MDINSLIANYLQTSGSDLSVSEVAERMNNLGSQIGWCKAEGEAESIFTYGDEATEEELYNFIESTCSSIDDYDQFAEDVNLLFNILDTSGDGVLSDDELALFKRTSGSCQGQITDYKFYDLLKFAAKEGVIQSKIESTDSTEETSSSSEDTASTDDTTSAESVITLSDDEIEAIADKIANGEESLDDYTDSLSYSQYLQLEEAVNTAIANLNESDGEETEETDEDASVTTLSDDEIEEISNRIANGEESLEDYADSLSYSQYLQLQEAVDTAVANLNESDIEDTDVDDDVDTDDTSGEDTDIAADKNTDAEIYAANLHCTMKGAGTKESQFKFILNDENLSDDDWVDIIAAYNEEYGSFISDIDGDFKASGRGEIFNTIADKLISAAENGNEDAINVLCLEIHNATAGQFGTADGFIDSVISSDTSDDVLGAIIRNYSTVNEGSDIYSDIRGDFSWVTGESKLINRLNEALSNTK